MVEESKDLIEYKMRTARKIVNGQYFLAGAMTGMATMIITIVVTIYYASLSSPKLSRIIYMMMMDPEMRAKLDIFLILFFVFVIIGIIAYALACYYEEKMLKGDLSFVK